MAGITLYGDYHDLRNLYDDISMMMRPPAFEEDDLVLTAFLYDLRHAYEGQRIHRCFESDDDLRNVKYYGVEIIWPMFLFSVGLYRWGLAFIDSNKSQQANAYRLEQVVETTLFEANPHVAEQCMEWLRNFSGYPKGYLSQYFDECAFRYVFHSEDPKKRFASLPIILRSTFPLSDEYRQFEVSLNQKAKEKGCSVQELRSLTEWPKFEM